MAKPTDSELWATDANYAADGDSWSSTPTRVDPGATRRAEGAEPDTFPAQWFNHEVGVHGDHIDYIHGILEADGTESLPAVTRTIIFHPSIFRGFTKTTGGNLPVAAVAGAGSGWRLSLDITDNAILMCPLNGLLPFGASVTDIDLLINPGTHTVGGRFSVHAVQPDFSTPAIGSHTEVDFALTTGAVIEVLNLNVAFAIGSTFQHYLVYDSTDLTASADVIESLRIQFTDPGPRNF